MNKRMPMKLVNASLTFSRLMQSCIDDHNLEMMILFMDDILLYIGHIGRYSAMNLEINLDRIY